MANIIKVKRGLSSDLASLTLQEGEIAFTTDTKKLYISSTKEPINNNTTYSISKSGSTITLTGSDGSTSTVSDSDTKITVDSALSSTSTNPVQNKVINIALAGKANTSAIPTKTSQLTNDSGFKTTDNNTTYTLTQDSSDGHKITLTPSSGTATTITIPDNNTTYSAATTSAAGLMSAADKTKLDGIDEGANNYAYTLPNASSSTLGGVKIGSNITVSSGTISLSKANVTNALGYTPPTTNTTYNAATTSAAGLMSTTDKAKLDGIATGATKNTASSTTPKAAGTASVGSETAYARGDHVHAAQTTVSGNAGSATKLATARNFTIGKTAKSFNGTAAVSWTLDEIGSNVYVGTSAPSDADVDVWIDPTGAINLNALWNSIYPVGAIYMSVNATNPGTLFPGTTWTQITDKYLLAAGSTYTAGSSYGAATHTHTSAAHTHTVNAHTHTSAAHTHSVNGHTHTSAAHTHTTGDCTLTIDQMPSHNHPQNYSPGGADTNRMVSTNTNGQYSSSDNIFGKSQGSKAAAQAGWTSSANVVGTGHRGGGAAHNHGATGSTTPGATGSTSLTTNSTTPGATGSTSLTTNSTTPGATGSASSLPPSIAVYMWKRTA